MTKHSLFAQTENVGAETLTLLVRYYGAQDVLQYIRALVANGAGRLTPEDTHTILGILDTSIDGACLTSLQKHRA